MAFDGGITASYLASFRPVEPVPGFPYVKSDEATKALTSIPERNLELQALMAQSALQQYGAIKQMDMQLDTRREELAAARLDRRRSAALQLAGQLFNITPAQLPSVSPADMMTSIQGMLDSQRSSRLQRVARPYAAATTALQSLPALS